MRLKVLVAVLLLVVTANAQQKRESRPANQPRYLSKNKVIPPARLRPRYLIDTPTARMLPRGAFDLDFRTFPQGGVQGTLSIGLADRFNVGIAYGGAGILSESAPEWNPRIEFLFRFLVVDESDFTTIPSLAIGYSSLGYGLLTRSDSAAGYYEDRYLVKSPGFYFTVSKRYPLEYGELEMHGGVNYSLENEIDSDPNPFIGMHLGLGSSLIYLAEYDFALNDSKRAGLFGLGRGYLNMGIAWFITPELSLELDFRNLLLNRYRNLNGATTAIDREIRLVYVQFFAD